MKRRLISIMLVIAMVLSVVPATVFATGSEPEKDKIVYVSIGDSMTNGYGLDGYDGSSGIVNYANQTYSNQFAAWLAGYTGEIVDDQVIFEGDKAIVDHRQLAMSGMRAEDVHWALELDYTDEEMIRKLWQYQHDGNSWNSTVRDAWYGEMGFQSGDYRTWADLVDSDYRYADGAARILNVYNNNPANAPYFQSSYATDNMIAAVANGLEADPYFPGGNDRDIMGAAYLQISTEFFQKSVADADVISLALGNTNFGTYMLNEIMSVVMDDDTTTFVERYDIEQVIRQAKLNPAMEAELRKLMDECDVIIDSYFAGLAGGDEAKMDALRNIITYCVVSYLVNYIGAVDAILTLNPDADIIQVALMNAYAVEREGTEDTTLGDIVDVLYTPINGFIAAMPTYMQATGNDLYKNATFYYAEADTVGCMVEVFGDDFYKQDGRYVEYPGLLEGGEGYEGNAYSTVRDRFVENIVRDKTFALIGSFTDVDRTIGVTDIMAYDLLTPMEKATFAAQNAIKAKSIALYLAFENATILAGEGTVTMDSLAALSADLLTVFQGIMANLEVNATGLGMEKYLDDVAAVVVASSGGRLTAEQVKNMILGGDAAIYAFVSTAIGGELTAEEIQRLCDAEGSDAAIFAIVAGKSEGQLDGESLAAIYTNVDTARKTAEAYGADPDAAEMTVYYNVIAGKVGQSVDTVRYLYEIDRNAYIVALIDGLKLAVTSVNRIKASYANIATNVESLKFAVDSGKQLCYLLGLPESLSTAMVEDSTLAGILCMNARCLIGTGIGGHPSEGGHDSVFAAVKSSYENDYTSAKKTLENAWYLIREYYDEAYAYAYDYAEAEGYIDAAIAGIDGVIAELEAIKAQLVVAPTAAGIQVASQMTPEFKAELVIQIDKTIDTLVAAKALLEEADELDQPTLDALLALLNEAGDSIAHILHLLEQAGIDVNQLAIIPALKAAHKELTEVVIPAIVEDLKVAVKAGTEWLLEKMGEAFDALVDALVAHVTEKAPEAADWIYNWLYNNPEIVIAFFNEYGDDMIDFLTEYGDEAALVIAYLINEYGEEVAEYVLNNADEILVAIVKWFEIHGENTWELVKVYLDALGITDCVNNTIEQIVATLTAEVERAKAELEAAINELKAMLKSLEEQLAEKKAQLEKLYAELADLYEQLENAAEEAKAAIEEAIAKIEALIAEIEALIEEIEAAIEEIKAALAELEAMLAEIKEALANLGETLKQLEAAIAKMIKEGFNAAAAEVQAALDAVAAAIEELVALVSEEIAAQIEKLLEELKAMLNERYLQITHGEYEINPDSYYIALGDGTAYGDSYVDMLAAELDALCSYTYNYMNLAEEDAMIQDAYQVILDNVAEIAKADLVTLGYGNNGFTNFTIAYMMALINGEAAELDWNTYVGEEGMPYVEELKAKLYEEMAASGVEGEYMGVDVTELMVAAVEAYAYSYVAYTCNLPEVVNTIHTINPEAQVIVVGMYNPLEGVALDLDGTKLNIGEYIQYMVDAANVTAITYAMITGDVIYVDAPAVEVKNTKTEMTVLQFMTEYLYYKAANLNPTEAGHAYITECILNALTITVVEAGLLGDADSNGVVNTLDALLVLQYYTGAVTADEINLAVCDLDGNGVVNTVDALLILQYYTGAIEKFPVEG